MTRNQMSVSLTFVLAMPVQQVLTMERILALWKISRYWVKRPSSIRQSCTTASSLREAWLQKLPSSHGDGCCCREYSLFFSKMYKIISQYQIPESHTVEIIQTEISSPGFLFQKTYSSVKDKVLARCLTPTGEPSLLRQVAFRFKFIMPHFPHL